MTKTSQHIPARLWGKDHWSMLGYVGSICVDLAGFQIGLDARMRQNRGHYVQMLVGCPRPRRVKQVPVGFVQVMDDPRYATRLRDGTLAPNFHDDWDCLGDIAAEGLLRPVNGKVRVTPKRLRPRFIVNLSEKGWLWLNAVNQHKAGGGSFGNFDPINAGLEVS